MHNLKILDVTLRDGGYRNNFNFTAEFAERAVAGLHRVGVQFVEVGYKNGSFIRRREHGLTSDVPDDLLDALAITADGQIGLCVMVHPHNVDDADFANLASHRIEMVRVCLRDDRLDAGLETIAQAKRHGLIVSANITRATEIPLSSIVRIATKSEEAGADLVCVADSNGSMIPSEVEQLFNKLAASVGIPTGFHAHNHLSLALSNAIAAIAEGAEYIDTAIGGMGKGAGNLHLAMLIAYLDRVGARHDYDLVEALRLSAHVASEVSANSLPHPLMDIMMGAYNLSIEAKSKIESNITEDAQFDALKSIWQNEAPPSRGGRRPHWKGGQVQASRGFTGLDRVQASSAEVTL